MNNLDNLYVNTSMLSLVDDNEENDEQAETIDIHQIDVRHYEKYLNKKNMSDNTVKSYTWTVKNYFQKYKHITKKNLLSYKGFLMENYSPRTVNLRILGINSYLKYIRKTILSLQCIKIQQKPYLENVVSLEDYKKLIKYMKINNHMTMYFVTKFMACTGARVSEVVKIKKHHIEKGIADLYSKGGKIRRIYINCRLKKEMLIWLEKEKIEDGYIFLNKNNIQLSTRGIAKELKNYAERCGGIDLDTIYPHSFRHMFAICFLEKRNDLALLADLLGHSSIETTRIYTRMTTAAQIKLIDKIVTW